MRIQLLRAFLKILETQNFTAAADSMYISQSALSKQIADLEKVIGQQLLQRSTRSVKPTAAGIVFRKHALRILEEWEVMLQEMSSIQAQKKEKICLGYTTSEQLTFVRGGIKQEEWEEQKCEVTLRKEHPDRVIRMLRDGRMDCAVMHWPTLNGAQDLDVHVLISTRIQAVIHSDHPLAGQKCVTLSQLSAETDVRCIHDYDPYYYDAIDAEFVRAGLEPPKRIETGESEELEILAHQPGRMSLCPSIYPVWEGFVSIPIADCGMNFDFIFVRNQENGNPQLDVLEEVIRRAMRESYL